MLKLEVIVSKTSDRILIHDIVFNFILIIHSFVLRAPNLNSYLFRLKILQQLKTFSFEREHFGSELGSESVLNLKIG